MIEYIDKGHKYVKGDQKYTSVSEFIGLFKNKFDQKYWSTYKAYEHLLGKQKFKELRAKAGYKLEDPKLFVDLKNLVSPEDLKRAKQEIKDDWKKINKISTTRGNLYHNDKEEQAYSTGICVNPFDYKEYPTKSTREKKVKRALVPDLFQLEDGFYPELLLWNDPYLLGGQSDKVFIETIDSVRYVDVDDYKTNNAIKKGGMKRMKYPIQNLYDCNYEHYCLQIAAYAWMLEGFGYVVRNTAFTHLNEMHPVDYQVYKNYLIAMLNEFRK